MKFSNAALAVLPFPFVAFTQLVSRTKAASTTGLTIADGMVVELCEGTNITADIGGDWSPALVVGNYSSNGDGGASLTITGGSYKSIIADGMQVNGGSFATVLGGLIQGGKNGVGMFVNTGAVATVLGGTIQGGKYGAGMVVYEGAVAKVLGGTIRGGQGDGMVVSGDGAVATVLGGTIQGGKYRSGMSVDFGAVATVCDGTIQGGTGGYGYNGVELGKAAVRIAGGIVIGGNDTASNSRYGFINYYGDATITGGTFKGGFNSTSGDQAPSLVAQCGNTSIYGGTYEGNWTYIESSENNDDDDSYDDDDGNYGFCDIYTKVYGKDLVFKDSHLMGTLCDGNLIDVYILGDPSTVYTENNCTSFPKFDECGGKGGKSGKKTKSSLFRP